MQSAHAKLEVNQFEGVRPLGMGNAFSAIADDSDALWYNPAGLANIKGLHTNLVDFIGGLDSLNTFTRISSGVASNDYQSAIVNSKQYFRLGTMPTFMTPFFAMQTFATSASYIEIQGLTLPNLNLHSRTDFGAIMGFGFPIGRLVKFGFSVRGFIRAGLESEITPEDLLNQLSITQQQFESNIYGFLNELAGVGYAFAGVVGMLIDLPVGDAPAVVLSGVVEDVGFTSFTALSNGQPVPKRVNQLYTAGAALKYKLSKSRNDPSEFIFSIDARGIQSGLPLFKMANAGMELKLQGFSFRCGYHQGDWTGGFTFDALPHTKFSYATYSKELSDTSRTYIRRWHVMRLSIGFQPS